jgi:hypothetical protein
MPKSLGRGRAVTYFWSISDYICYDKDQREYERLLVGPGEIERDYDKHLEDEAARESDPPKKNVSRKPP